MKCKFCGTKIASVCKDCGTINPITAKECSNCHKVLLKICTECGAANLPEAKACRKCGMEFVIPQKKFNPKPEYSAEMNSQQKVKARLLDSIKDADKTIITLNGESGIGKCEAALELIKRGHRLVSDDVVEIRKVSDETLVGTAPDITKHFIELRGIGIVDVKVLYGVQSVRETQNIDLVITLEDWNKDKEYDRLGLEEEYTEFLGNQVVCHQIPIRPGRNLAIIVETAAINHRQKQMGYNAAKELYKRVQANMTRK